MFARLTQAMSRTNPTAAISSPMNMSLYSLPTLWRSSLTVRTPSDVGLRVLFCEPLGHHSNLGPGLTQLNARVKARHYFQAPFPALIPGLIAQRQRSP